MPDILMVMGSESDFKSMLAGVEVLEQFGVEVNVQVASAHRTPARVEELLKEAESNGTQLVIAAAGMSAHLAGVCAGKTTLPVIGVPMDSPHMNGVDSLYSTVMMPPGIPVGTVGIGKPGAKNAAYFAVSILALKDENVRQKLHDYRAGLPDAVGAMNDRVQAQLQDRGA